MDKQNTSGTDEADSNPVYVLAKEMREIVTAIRTEIEMTKEHATANTNRIAAVEEMTASHIKACEENKEDMKAVLKTLNELKGWLAINIKLRNFILYICGGITGVSAAIVVIRAALKVAV